MSSSERVRTERLREAIGARVLVFDGATGTNLQALGLGTDDFGGAEYEGCNEVLVRTRPEVVCDLHRAFLEAGVDIVTTNSFGAARLVLAEYGLEEESFELNRSAAALAREVADSFSTAARPRFVAGSIGPGTKLPSLGQVPFARLRDDYELQAKGLLVGGVDLVVVETVFDLLQAKAAIIGARRAMRAMGRQVPLQVQVTMELTGTMLPGTEIGAALVALRAMGPDVLGLNCATGPDHMREHLRHLQAASPLPIACQPNAGLPRVSDDGTHYDLGPDELAAYLGRFVDEYGVSLVGGCCGTTPEHLAAVVEACSGRPVAAREPTVEPAATSLYAPVAFTQDTAYLAIGERANANGSRQFREAMLAGDWDECVRIATSQAAEGAHLLDLCVDYTGADGASTMAELASRLATASTLPLVLDSTEPAVIEVALSHLGGRAVLNSVNLEEGDGEGTRFDRFCTLAAEHGAALIVTCIDERGQARTAEWKLEAATAIVERATTRYGLRREDIFVDPLVLALSTGMEESRRDGLETIEAIRLIKATLPGCHTVIGLSNVSFGLSPSARQVLNTVFLHECVEAGLDAAIAHAGRILPLASIDPGLREACLDLIYDRRRDDYDPLEQLLGLDADTTPSTSKRKEERATWPVERRLEARIVEADRNGLEEDLDEILSAGTSPLDVVNDTLLSGMRRVGELFASGELQLPFVLQSAETMKRAVGYLEPHMERAESHTRGTVVLATVRGDVHDIGKNLVDIILSNNGYAVHNLGIKVPVAEIIAKAVEVDADAIGMSGLLVKSTIVMRENLEELSERGLSRRFPVLLGGAALNRTYVERELRARHDGRLFYGRDAFEGLATMDRLMEIKHRGIDDPDFGRALGGTTPVEPAAADQPASPTARPARSDVARDNPIPSPPFVGARVALGIPVEEIAAFLNETALFRHQWGYRPTSGEPDGAFKDRIRMTLREVLDRATRASLLEPKVAYGYFPANADGDDLVIFEDESRGRERVRFSFPRQSEAPWRCIADYFRPIGHADPDWAAFHVVTMGPALAAAEAGLFATDRYGEYLHLHGLGVEMTEALAECWHKRIRVEWGFADEDGPTPAGLFRQQYRGGRYSFGYPACPDLEHHALLAELLDLDCIGVSLSGEFQLHPEQSTSALICHHPEAKYFVVRRTRAERHGEQASPGGC